MQCFRYWRAPATYSQPTVHVLLNHYSGEGATKMQLLKQPTTKMCKIACNKNKNLTTQNNINGNCTHTKKY